MVSPRRDAALFTVSVAAELAGIHPQTLRQYDRLGLVVPQRTRGGGRRYSLADVERLQEIQRLSQDEGVSLAGIARIFELQDEVERLRSQVRRLRSQVEKQGQALAAQELERNRVFAAGADGDVFMAADPSELRVRLRETRARRQPTTRGTIVVWQPSA